MRVLVTGGSGVLGAALTRTLRGMHAVRALDRSACDVTESFTVQRIFSQLAPDVVIHCAALSRFASCETRPDLAYRTNAQGSANVAAACQRLGARLIAFSTAAVFDGQLDRPYHEQDLPNPQTAYGRSKLAAEQLIHSQCDDYLILRLSWVYGASDTQFSVRVLDEAARPGPPLRVINDQRGCPTSADAIAQFTRQLLERKDLQGIYHVASAGETTWFEAARTVALRTGSKRKIIPCPAKDYPRPARHPDNARLVSQRFNAHELTPAGHWLADLETYVDRPARRMAA